MLRAGGSPDGTEVGPRGVPAGRHLVAHAVGLEVAFHALLGHTARDHLEAHALVGVDPPRRRRGETSDDLKALREDFQRHNRVDVVVRVAGAERRLQDDFGLKLVVGRHDQRLRGVADALRVVILRLANLDVLAKPYRYQ